MNQGLALIIHLIIQTKEINHDQERRIHLEQPRQDVARL